MVIPIMAMGAAGLTVLPLWLLTIRFVQRDSLRIVAGLFLLFPLSLLFHFYFQAILASTVSYGLDVDSGEVPYLHVPDTATDISFYSVFGPTCLYAEFTITEEDFLQWMKSGEWDVEQIKDVEEVCAVADVIDGTYDRREVKAGFRWDSYDDSGNDDSGTTVIFDQRNSRAYVTITRW